MKDLFLIFIMLIGFGLLLVFGLDNLSHTETNVFHIITDLQGVKGGVK